MHAAIVEIKALPENFSRFAEEIAAGLGSLYGEAAGRDYLSRARAAFSVNLAHPGVIACAALLGEEAWGLAAGTLRGDEGHIFLVHVLGPWQGRGIEADLLRVLCGRLRARGARRILCEMIPLCALAVEGVMAAEGFDCVPRRLLRAALSGAGLLKPPLECSVALEPRYWGTAAACVVDAYRGHPGARLHAEVRSEAEAERYVARVAGGSYGVVRRGFLRAILRGDRCDGVVLGAIIAPGTGFVLQVAVRREKQGHGLGTDLLRGLAAAFRDAGLRDVALGVTRGNPAEGLYARLGFEVLREVNAYVWEA